MSKQTNRKEQLSALMDGEADNMDRAIDQLLSDPTQRAEWENLHFNRDVAGGHIDIKASAGFADAVMAALDDEPTVLAPKSVRKSVDSNTNATVSWLRPAAGLAIAATVAAVTVLSFDSLVGEPSAPAQVQQLAAQQSAAPQAATITPVQFTGAHVVNRTYWQGSDENMQDELNQYLANHTEYSDVSNFQGMLPYVRLAGYDSEEK